MKKVYLITLLICLFVLTGCKSKESLYYHGNYNQILFAHFKGETKPLSQQIEELESIIKRAEEKSKLVAPGIYAHLGYLYSQVGNDKQGLQYFRLEKRYFPESEAYIQFLEENLKGAEK
ncbi:DUF4810 domain-containing protein [Pseudoalteromonas phenolica]|uniref:DUF4810 domain-containing protein n=1 Tax=Pseudoalteromonas phenolica TaxID=161398 RepID=UPI00110AC0BE|nr:DUF4810 domain-containing protein [Pseudoalteromonas phenolica]TMO54730.1 DUF4810 domain-containing protein [Pseudoalteromonas phenolica]|tara:strand:- start:623 stop:979 length:357 start_codon:yes stop_codon:yes gene_type:complete